MTGAPIDGSIRRAVLTDESSGNIVSDSRKKLDDAPLAILEPGTEDIALNFLDKKGLTDDYGNVYLGYINSGGSSFSVSNTSPESIDDEADDANDGDVLVYVGVEEKYLPFSFEDAGIPRASTVDLPNDEDILVYDNFDEEYKPKALSELPVAIVGGAVPAEGDFLVYDDGPDVWKPSSYQEAGIPIYDGSDPEEGDLLVWSDVEGKFVPTEQNFVDFICVVIETPVNKVYTITMGLPYDILITGVSDAIEVGPYTLSGEPSGTISAGTPLTFTVGSTNATSAFLRVQIEFIRSLGIVA